MICSIRALTFGRRSHLPRLSTAATYVRLIHLLDDPLFMLTTGGGTTLVEHKDTPWVAGCERCRSLLVEMCEQAGFSPRLAYNHRRHGG
ncbi:MAG: hypothetical protein ACRDWI_07165 [Jiangellaceae bacterium]